jgi:hypothetical protein
MFMKKIFLGLILSSLLIGCGSNEEIPTAPDPSSVPKGDGSAPKNEPGVLKAPSRRGGGTAIKGGGASTPAER